MQKQIGAILLVAGTCIGSGMIALPMMLAKLGLIPSIALMLIIWVVMYYTSLINLELNLKAEQGLGLGALGRLFSGRIAELTGTISLKLLSYSLIAVFIYAGTSVVQKLLLSLTGIEYSFAIVANCYTLITIGLLLMPIRFIDHTNRLLFIGLIAVIAILIAGLSSAVQMFNLPIAAKESYDISTWPKVIPVVFTSFGFQVIFHTLTNYCNKDKKMLKRAFLCGSLLPALVYIIWTSSVLSVIYTHNPIFYQQMIKGSVEVGSLIEELSNIAKWPMVQILVWWVSILAIFTSVIGVGIGLVDSLKHQIKVIKNKNIKSIVAVLLAILPAHLIAILVPNAFIAVLGFAGMILVVIAILMPIYLLYKAKTKILHYTELKYHSLIIISAILGIVVILCEVYNMI